MQRKAARRSVAFALLRNAAKKGTDLSLTVTAVAAQRTDRRELASLRPTCDRLGVNTKHRRHFGWCEQWLCLGCTSACQGNFLLVGPATADPPTNGAGGCRSLTTREAASRSATREAASRSATREAASRSATRGSRAIDPLNQILALVQDVRNGPTGSSFDLRGLVRDTPFSPRWPCAWRSPTW